MHEDNATAAHYRETLALLQRALDSLDALNEHVAAAHLSGVIAIVAEKIGSTNPH